MSSGRRTLVAGVDEVGRGPLAGPVVAAAVILSTSCTYEGLVDSKRLSPIKREHVSARIRATAQAWCLAAASAGQIDRLNIHQATLLVGHSQHPQSVARQSLHGEQNLFPILLVDRPDGSLVYY